MLRRPDAGAGCGWMQRWDESIPAPGPVDPVKQQRYRRFMIGFWIVWAAFMVMGHGLTHGISTFGPLPPYESSTHIAGLPLFAYGQHARGIVAVGGFSVGLIAVGGVAIGGIAFGGVAIGGIALSGVSLGILAIAGLAAGWWAVGGGAFGYYAFGGLAFGGHAYAGGGVAYGYYTASGRQKEKLLG
jgi:hypothetical protein